MNNITINIDMNTNIHIPTNERNVQKTAWNSRKQWSLQDNINNTRILCPRPDGVSRTNNPTPNPRNNSIKYSTMQIPYFKEFVCSKTTN